MQMPDGFKPMLAVAPEDKIGEQHLPGLLSPKLDGWRCLVTPQGVLSRTFKLIPNRSVQETLGRPEFWGFDGELIVGDPTAKGVMQTTHSGLAKETGAVMGDIGFHVFDDFSDVSIGFARRQDRLQKRLEDLEIDAPWMWLVEQHLVTDLEEVWELEDRWVSMGYEGAMLRSLAGPYKFGRSTEREGYLLKIKRWEDAEGVIVGFVQAKTNQNAAEKDAFGRTKRSTKQEGMVLVERMGSFEVESPRFKKRFTVGAGPTHEDTVEQWQNREQLMGATITFEFGPGATEDAPRFPLIKAIRRDLA